ncbi:MAG: type VI secretion system membrane subunit TssM, partial [Proteobacteria bacterium]|nr:type VI secretion system membrane subunit TssM [Pseudomonadota bacterium]
MPFVNEAFAASSFDAPMLLRGVYLTSGTQESTPIDRAISAVARTFGVDAGAAPRPVGAGAAGRAYFIERLLREVVFREEGLAGINRRVELRKMAAQIAAYVGCAILAVGGVLAFWISYERNVTYLGEVAGAVQKYKDSPAPPSGISGRRLTDALPRLAAARDVAMVANAHRGSVPLSMRFWLYRGAIVGATADDAYLRELSGSLLPVLGEGFQAGLVSMVAEPDKLYEYLNAYMMLGEPKKLDRDQLGALANLEWRRLLADQPSSRSDLQEHTTAMFADAARLRPLVLDRPLVERTQAALANASLPVLMYGRLKLAYAGDREHAVRFDRVAGSTQVFVRRSGAPLGEPLSAVYTRGAFDDFQSVGRLKLVKQFQEDGWILGASAPPLTAMREVSDAVLRLYEDDYIHAWDEVLKDVNVRKPKDPRDLEQLLRILGSPASPLKEFMGIVARNTNFALAAPGAAAKAKQSALSALESKTAQLDQMMGGGAAPEVAPGARITQHFEAYNALVAGAPGPAPIDRILQSFGKAANDLAAGASGTTPGAKAGQADVLRQLQGEVSLLPPAAMGQLISDVGTGSQEVVSGEVRSELGQAYQQQVVRACREAIAGRYPFEPAAANEVPLDDFARVFGPNGTYDTFFKENLQALVDTSRNPWQWREGAGTAAAVPGLLSQFKAAERIRELFFRPGSAMPDVRFTLTPVSLDADATRFVLDLDGHPLEYRHGPIKSLAMQWPSGPTGQASVQFEPMSGGGAAFTGPWSLFRLLARAQVQPQSDVRFLLTFSAGSATAKVQLEAASVRNPFAHPEVLRFRCG